MTLYIDKPADKSYIEYKTGNGLSVFKVKDDGVTSLGSLLGSRFALTWIAGQRAKPAANGDILDASAATRMIADPTFELLGTNAVSSCSAFNAEGGIKLTTTTGSADQVILTPHQDASQSPWKQTTWGTDQQVRWEAIIKTGSAITAQILWLGLKLTNTPVIATDANQLFFRYEAGVASGKWVCVTSIGDTDTSTNSVVAVVNTVYHFVIDIDSSRIAKCYLNGPLIKTTAALTDATDLIPFIAIQTSTTAAKHVIVRGQSISRVYS